MLSLMREKQQRRSAVTEKEQHQALQEDNGRKRLQPGTGGVCGASLKRNSEVDPDIHGKPAPPELAMPAKHVTVTTRHASPPKGLKHKLFFSAPGAALAQLLAFVVAGGLCQHSRRAASYSIFVAEVALIITTTSPIAAAPSSSPSISPPSSSSTPPSPMFPEPPASLLPSNAAALSPMGGSQKITIVSAKPVASGARVLSTAAMGTNGGLRSPQEQQLQRLEMSAPKQRKFLHSRKQLQQPLEQRPQVQLLEQQQQHHQAEHVVHQQAEKEARHAQLSVDQGVTHRGSSLNTETRMAPVAFRQVQQQQPGGQAKDADWTGRVRISSRSFYATKDVLPPREASALGGAFSWEAKTAGTGETVEAAAAGESTLAGSNSRSTPTGEAERAAEARSNLKREHHLEADTHGPAAQAAANAQKHAQEGRQQHSVVEVIRQAEPGVRRSRQVDTTEGPQQRNVTKEQTRVALLQQNYWREGVDNKRFPCVLTGKNTAGSALKEVPSVRTEHKCQRLCRRLKNCTHAVLNTSKNICTLKAGVIDPTEGAEEDIVIPYNCADCWHVNSGIKKESFLRRNLYSPFGCLTYCLSQPKCTWWQYSVLEEKCLLFENASASDVERNRGGQVAGQRGWCELTAEEKNELNTPEGGEASLGSGWIKSQCMHPPHTKSTSSPFEQLATLNTADLCQKQCQKKPFCRYFDFNRTGTICRLFERKGYEVQSATNYVAGPRTCNMSCFLAGRAFRLDEGEAKAQYTRQETAETAMDCQVKCNEDPTCKRFSYCTETGQCTLSKIGPSRSQTQTRSSGKAKAEDEEHKETTVGEQEEESTEYDLLYRTKEEAGCYVGPATFCPPRPS